VTALSAREGYRLWAPQYEAETAVSCLEDMLVREADIHTAGRSVVDVGCGTGRRLRDTGAAVAVGVDLSVEMLALADSDAIAAADVRALPFAESSFDVVWCRLMIGHVVEVDAAYGELGRVCRNGGIVIVSDLSPEAVEAGHRRTFRDVNGELCEVEHFVHSLDEQVSAARVVGLELHGRLDGRVGPEIESFYARAGRRDLYSQQIGLPLVRVLVWRKAAGGVRNAAQRSATGVRHAADVREGETV
jgi:malonyl-CoA O-methyltransferase